MSDLPLVCETCNTRVRAVFDPMTGTRQNQVIAGDLLVTEQCFVRDEIRFLNGGRLIFAPHRERKQYFDRYFVICRKLIVIGGFKSGGGFNPCGPDDPGTEYRNNNVITWLDRLTSAANGPNIVASAADGDSFGNWADMGQGNNGATGGAGATGDKGHTGGNGMAAPRELVLVVLEVDVQPLSHLTIDWDGQNGGNGGRGQNGGKGGKGMAGRIGSSDTTWPGTGCDRDPGNGGDGGRGGDGGPGGDGGRGGDAGEITVFSTMANITTGPLVSGDISYVNDGGIGGRGGGSGVGGAGGLGAMPGFPTSECGNAQPGQAGQEGAPFPTAPLIDVDPNRGSPGGTGSGASLSLNEIRKDTCADLLPASIVFGSDTLAPAHFCRGFSTPGNGDASVVGEHFDQITAVTASLAGVTVTKKLSSTDTQLDLRVQIAGNSATGNATLTFQRVFGPPQTLPNAFTVGKFEVLTVSPSSGTKGTAVNVTITGNCFDPTAGFQQVTVSGLGVTVMNVVVVDEHTVQAVFDIAALTGSGARDVTVKTGTYLHTLVNAFTIS